jgi:hypothetical protein
MCVKIKGTVRLIRVKDWSWDVAWGNGSKKLAVDFQLLVTTNFPGKCEHTV